MVDNQLIIKVALITVFVLFALLLVIPRRGARYLAVRRLALLAVFAAGIVAIAFPETINAVANLVGVGRGTDLLLYTLVIVYIGNSISSSLRYRHQEREMTLLARELALRGTEPPAATPETAPAPTRSPRAAKAAKPAKDAPTAE